MKANEGWSMGALMEEESEQEAGQESAGRLRDAIEQREESKRKPGIR
jgi:hypothetical protein